MTCFRKALIISVFSGGLVAAPTTAWGQSAPARFSFLSETIFEFEADLDLVVGVGESAVRKDSPYADLTLRGSSETLTDQGWRYGAELEARLTSGDGHRGLARPGLTGPRVSGRPVAGLLTGLSGEAGLDDASARVIADQAQVYLQTAWVKLRAGLGETAAELEASDSLHVFRLIRAQGGKFDLSGLNIADTGLTLADAAPTVSVQSRRIVGLRFAASFAPDSDPCAQACHPAGPEVLRADLGAIWSVAASFDRRAPSTGVRWNASLGFETAQAEGPVAAMFDDPWLMRGALVRQAGDLTLSLSGLTGSDGYQDAEYDSLGFGLAYEQGDWLYGAELGYGQSDLVGAETVSVLLGVSRLVGANGLLGLGVMSVRESAGGTDRDSVQVLVETGLRF
ncbi:porin [Oceanicaulis sp.]|uniref:porin n=1 Tax=Oceanicaulis sp. TaxID=1924941 RepID=UPI003D28462F